MAEPKPLLSGSCACSSITYTSTSPPQHLDYCYCLSCRLTSGGAFAAWTGIPKTSLTWTFAHPPLLYRAPVGDTDIVVAERTCCGICGCNVSLQYFCYPEKTHVAAGTILEGKALGGLKVGCHIWTRRRPGWYEIPEDGVDRFDEFDPEFRDRLEEWLGKERSGS